MTLFSSWMTFNDLILLSLQQCIWNSSVIPRALFLLQMELPALNDHFNIWVWLLLGHLWLNHRNLKWCSHRWPHLSALNKRTNALRQVKMVLDSFCQVEVNAWTYVANTNWTSKPFMFENCHFGEERWLWAWLARQEDLCGMLSELKQNLVSVWLSHFHLFSTSSVCWELQSELCNLCVPHGQEQKD